MRLNNDSNGQIAPLWNVVPSLPDSIINHVTSCKCQEKPHQGVHFLLTEVLLGVIILIKSIKHWIPINSYSTVRFKDITRLTFIDRKMLPFRYIFVDEVFFIFVYWPHLTVLTDNHIHKDVPKKAACFCQ